MSKVRADINFRQRVIVTRGGGARVVYQMLSFISRAILFIEL